MAFEILTRFFPRRSTLGALYTPEYRERVAPLQRPGDGAYINMYWDAYTRQSFSDVVALIYALTHARNIEHPRILDFGCGAGPLYRALKRHLPVHFGYVGVDADARAVEFLREQAKDRLILEGDQYLLSEYLEIAPLQVDCAVTTSCIYALSPEAAAHLVRTFSRMSDLVVIGDQIENFDGESAETMSLIDADGRPYEAQCMPFGRIFAANGLRHTRVVPIAATTKSLTGYMVASRHELPDVDVISEVLFQASIGNLAPKIVAREPRRVRAPYLRSEYDVSEPQVESLPDGSTDTLTAFVDVETIANYGIKLSAPVPSGGKLQFEVECDGQTYFSTLFNSARETVLLEPEAISESDIFPRKSYPEKWSLEAWGSWGPLELHDGGMSSYIDDGTDIDANQADGIGPLDLLFYTYPHGADMRDVEIRFEARGIGFASNDAEILIHLQNDGEVEQLAFSNAAKNSNYCVRYSADYTYTARPITRAITDSWLEYKAVLRNVPSDWTFAGNVLADGDSAPRYSYANLNTVLRNVHNLHILACYPNSVPDILNKRNSARYGKRIGGRIALRNISLKPSSEANANADFLLRSGASGRFRAVTFGADGSTTYSEWRSFTLPPTLRPQVHHVSVEGDLVTVRINPMGFRTWCWASDDEGDQRALYLGCTKHGRTGFYHLQRTLAGAATLIVGNEHGRVAVPLDDHRP
ncbi:MAG: class I SAM-dependent methyltransferase [Gammaproteobacteria bacterium]